MIKSRVRLILTIIMLVITLAALTWGFLPGFKVVRRQIIQPTQMQLYTPSSMILPAGFQTGVDPVAGLANLPG